MGEMEKADQVLEVKEVLLAGHHWGSWPVSVVLWRFSLLCPRGGQF